VESASEQIDRRRRRFMVAATIGALAYQIGGVNVLLTPAEARAKGASLFVLSKTEARGLEALGECLVPGARVAGIAHYVDANLRRPAAESLLMLRYLDVLPPHSDFYRHGLAALDGASMRQHGKVFADLDDDAASSFVATIAKGDPHGWQGPPAALFYFAARGDAVDIVYGTRAGFDRLSVPYLAHIEPKSDY
jgi:hypothetical protein